MLNRRAFLGRLAGAFAAALASPPVSVLARHTLGSFGAPPTVAVDRTVGIAIRFIRNFDIVPIHASRLDVIYGTGYVPQPRGSFAAYLEADRLAQERATVVPCAYCIRMVGDHCRKRGCIREQYYRGALDLPAGFDWDPSL